MLTLSTESGSSDASTIRSSSRGVKGIAAIAASTLLRMVGVGYGWR